MFRIIEKLSNIRWFAISNNEVFVNTSKEVISIGQGRTLYKSETDLMEIYFKYDSLFINNLYGKGIVFNKEFNYIELDYYVHYIKSNYLLCSIREDEERNTLIQNINDLNETYRIIGNSTIFFVSKGKYFRKNFQENLIETYSYPTSNFLWQFSLLQQGTYINHWPKEEKPYEVQKFLGVRENMLLVELSNSTYVGIDINTGKKLLDFSIFKHYPHLEKYLTGNAAINITIKEPNHLIILTRMALFHYHFESKNLHLIKDYTQLPKEQWWEFRSGTYHEGKIYFTGDYGNEYVFATRIGVMNAETGEVLWQQQLEKTGGLPNAPQVTEDKLYVLTVNKELYIFQKQPENV